MTNSKNFCHMWRFFCHIAIFVTGCMFTLSDHDFYCWIYLYNMHKFFDFGFCKKIATDFSVAIYQLIVFWTINSSNVGLCSLFRSDGLPSDSVIVLTEGFSSTTSCGSLYFCTVFFLPQEPFFLFSYIIPCWQCATVWSVVF